MLDHAGRPTTSFNPSAFGLGKDAGTGGMSGGSYRAFVREVRRRRAEPAWSLFLGGLMVLLIILSAPLLVSDIVSDGFSMGSIRQSVLLVVLALIALYAFSSPGLSHETMVDELLVRSRCASCGFHLGTIPPGADGLVCCPECEARWRIARESPSA